jgi:Zn-dependent protease
MALAREIVDPSLMGKIGGFLRFVFGFEALVFLFALPSSMYTLITMQTDGPWRFEEAALVILFPAVELILGVVTGIAWWSLTEGRPSARAWSIAASILNLFLVPVGPIFGIAGLIAFRRPGVVAETVSSSRKRRTPIAGDGTHKYAGSVLPYLAAVLLIVAANFWFRWGKRQGLESQPFWISLLEVVAALYVNTFFHELGHVLGGWASDMKLFSFAVGPLRFELRSGQWGCKFDPAGLWGGGMAGLVPTHLRDMRRRHLFMTAAGPIASLITAIVATAVALAAPGNAWAPAWVFFSALATVGWIYALYNCIPLRPEGPEDRYSDGAQIYQLLSNGPWAEFHMAFAMVGSSLVTPLRPRDFDIEVLNRAAAFMTTGLRGMLLNLYLSMHHHDCGRTAERLRYFEIAESMYPQIANDLPADLHLGFVYGNAVFKQDLAAAQLWWQRMEAKGKTRYKLDYWKARAALRWIEGDRSEAREAWRKADSWARQAPATGAYDFDRDEIARLGVLLDAAETTEPLVTPVL